MSNKKSSLMEEDHHTNTKYSLNVQTIHSNPNSDKTEYDLDQICSLTIKKEINHQSDGNQIIRKSSDVNSILVEEHCQIALQTPSGTKISIEQQGEEISKPKKDQDESSTSGEVINNSFRGEKASELEAILMEEPRYEGTQIIHSNDASRMHPMWKLDKINKDAGEILESSLLWIICVPS